MKCEDCGFEFDEGTVCPRCGYDPKEDLLAWVASENQPLTNPYEKELVALSKEVGETETGKQKIANYWKELDRKARQGDLDARHLFGRAALMQQNYAVARDLLSKLAAAGHTLAKLDLANIHEEGLGGEPDVFKAMALYRQAAAKGHPLALFKIAEQHGKAGGVLRTDPALSSAVMNALVTRYPDMFQRRQGCGCGGQGLTDQEFATQSASQMSKMIKYLVIAGVLALIGYIVWTEFFAR